MFQWAPARPAREEHLGAESKAGEDQPAKQSQGRASVCHRDVIEEAKVLRLMKIIYKCGECHSLAGSQYAFLY
jgi:hypothetical protein